MDKAKQYLKDNPPILEAVEAQVRDKVSPEQFTGAPEDNAADDSEEV